jgi:hypothetical protein
MRTSAMAGAMKGPNLRMTTEQLLIAFFALALRTIAQQVSRQAQRKRRGAGSTENAVQTNAQVLRWFNAFRSRRLPEIGLVRGLVKPVSTRQKRVFGHQVNARQREGIRYAVFPFSA